MDLARFLAFTGRAERREPLDWRQAGIFVSAPDGSGALKPELRQAGPLLLLNWEKLPRAALSLPWPVAGHGFSTVWADKGGLGFPDGEAVYLNEEIALTQHRLFKQAWTRHTKETEPLYKPGPKAKRLFESAGRLMAQAGESREGPSRAAAFDKALGETALAWETMLFEHGLQLARNQKTASALRFGLGLDASLPGRLDERRRIARTIGRSGANWVRLVFKANPADFAYARLSSFSEYDAIVSELRSAGLKVMACVLETGEWPPTLTPELYAERAKNLVLRYRGQIRSWEVGSELNGDWLGGARRPLASERIFKIHSAAAARVKEIDQDLETVATLYWWDGTAPDEEHSLFGWLRRYVPQGFGRDLDVVAISLQPDENPVGLALEPIFERAAQQLPAQRLMLGSLGYVEAGGLKGYWWLDPKDVGRAREDLAILYTTASCALPRSLGGGFWWQALEQMIPPKGKTALFGAYQRALEQLGR